MACHRTGNDYGTHDIPHRVLVLEKDLTALDARCRECREETRAKLAIIAHDISSFGQRVADDVQKINHRIDGLVEFLGNKHAVSRPRRRTRTKRHH